jgi:AcrR family transcriptional regulator
MDSRERLVVAMSDLMWERGYAATTPREVRERSGVGQGSMYHHFAGKRDLALAALERNCATLLPATEDLLTLPGDPMEKLTAYLSRPLPALKGCKVGRMTQDPLVAGDPGLLAPVADAFAAVHRALTAVIQEAIEQGELGGSVDAGRLAYLLSATIQGGYVLAIAAQDSRPFDDARAGALDLLRAAAPATGPAAAPAATPQGRKH